MRCDAALPLLGAWRDGELDVLTRARVGWHVRSCTECAAEAADLGALTARLVRVDPLAGFDRPRGLPRRSLWHAAPVVALASVALCVVLVRQWYGANPTVPVPVVATIVRPHVVEPVRRGVVPREPVMVAVAPSRQHIKIEPRQGQGQLLLRRRVRSRLRQPVLLAEKVMPRKRLAPTPRTESEVIVVSVKIADPQEVVQEMRAEIAEAQRAEAERVEAGREFIYVVATPEAVGSVVPVDVPTVETKSEKQP